MPDIINKSQKNIAYIGVGSNIGDRFNNIKSAENNINSSEFCAISEISKIYETEPVGYLEQDKFLNCVFKINTQLSPEQLLKFLLKTEKELKRERIIHWGPRTIDLDILFYNNLVISSEELIIPHPRMHERMFVLKPMCDLDSEYFHPVLHIRCGKMEENLKSEQTPPVEWIP